MSQSNTIIEALELMIKHENLMRGLYLLFQERFPDTAYFWNELADEEQNHAEMLTGLRDKIREGTVTFKNPPDFKELRISFEYLQKSLEFIKIKDHSLREALSLAEQFEKKTFDAFPFQYFQSSHGFLNEVFSILRQETKKHHEKIKIMLESMDKNDGNILYSLLK